MKRIAMLTLVSAVSAVALAATAVAADIHWDVNHVDIDGQMTVIVTGCDGLVAESDVMVDPGLTHNFPVSVHLGGWVKSSPDVPSDVWTAHYQIAGSGTDSAGHGFTIRGTLTNEGNGGSDFFATGGDIVVRRDDGAVARGPADAAANSIVYGIPSAIHVDAGQCRLK